MKPFIREMKRKISYEASCFDAKLTAIIAASFAALCILTSIFNVKSAVYKKFTPPKLSLSPFFCIFFWVIVSALLGAAIAIALSSVSKNKKTKITGAVSCACAFVLSQAWIVLVYSAAAFIVAALVSAVILLCLWISFTEFSKISRISSFIAAACAVWTVYVIYFSVALAFVS